MEIAVTKVNFNISFKLPHTIEKNYDNSSPKMIKFSIIIQQFFNIQNPIIISHNKLSPFNVKYDKLW